MADWDATERPDLEDIRERASPIAMSVPGVRGLSIYGSRSRGDAREDSDWDFMAVVDPDHPRAVRNLERALRTEFGTGVSVYGSDGYDDRWRRRIKGDLKLLWGDAIDWSDVVAFTREEAVRDRLAFQLEYVYYTSEGILETVRREGDAEIFEVMKAAGVCNTMRNIQRHQPRLYLDVFSDILPDAAKTQRIMEEEPLDSPSESIRFISEVMPVIVCRAGMELDKMGYSRPGQDWTSGLSGR